MITVNWDECGMKAALAAASQADVLIVTLGEHEDETGECTSRTSLALAQNQMTLLEAVRDLHKPVVSIVFSGRALELDEVCRYSDAVLQAWYLGTESGAALAEILSGAESPQGRLAISLPRKTGQMPLYYNNHNTGRPNPDNGVTIPYVTKYIDCENTPLFPFGFGLTYTTFEYSDAALSDEFMHIDETLYAEVTVKNTGNLEGREVVQLYLRDVSACVVRPVRELKAFESIVLQAGESRRLRFEITGKMLCFWDNKGEFKQEPGRFEVFIGQNSRDCHSLAFVYKKQLKNQEGDHNDQCDRLAGSET